MTVCGYAPAIRAVGVMGQDVDSLERGHRQGNTPASGPHRRLVSLVSWCFKFSQPQRIISGVRDTFIKRSIVERTNKAEMRPEEQSEKAENHRENLWNEIQVKGP